MIDETPFLLSDRDSAEILNISRATLWRRVKDGTLPKPLHIGGLRRWRRDELFAAIEDATARRDQDV